MQNRISSFAGKLKNASGSITAGSTPQTILEEDLGRRYLLIQNTSDTVMHVAFGESATTTNSIRLEAGSSVIFEFSFVPVDYVSLLCATAGKTFTCLHA